MRFPLNPSGREGTGSGSTYLNPRPISYTACILIRVTRSLCNQTATKPKYRNVTAMLPKESVEISFDFQLFQFLALCL